MAEPITITLESLLNKTKEINSKIEESSVQRATNIGDITSKLTTLQQNVTALSEIASKMSQSNASILKLNNEKQQLVSDLANCKSELARINEKVKQTELDLNAKSVEVDKKNTELEALKQSTTATNAVANEHAAKLTAEKETAMSELRRQTEEFDALKRDASSQQEKLTAINNELTTTLSKLVDTTTSQTAEAAQYIDIINKVNTQLQKLNSDSAPATGGKKGRKYKGGYLYGAEKSKYDSLSSKSIPSDHGRGVSAKKSRKGGMSKRNPKRKRHRRTRKN